ncbi:hypothetical protein ABQG71_21040 [Bacillus altitudinis]|uniref:Uncharacterized protein n=1 Tax=Bacillus altitudinis TaxID=293387 RepID=A0ABV1SBB2_BACAB|nr:hypothetical protein [Bacillus pumilus]
MKWMISLSLIALLITGTTVYSNAQNDQQITEKGVFPTSQTEHKVAEKGVVGA